MKADYEAETGKKFDSSEYTLWKATEGFRKYDMGKYGKTGQ